MLKAAVTWSFLESWLDGVLVCKYKLIFWKFCVEIQQKSRKIYSAFSYVYFNFIARPGNNQQDLKTRFKLPTRFKIVPVVFFTLLSRCLSPLRCINGYRRI